MKDLPPFDTRIDPVEQHDLLQACNLALLDEIKRLEAENREVKQLVEKKQLGS